MNNSLNILQISTNDVGGGAEKIAFELFNSYREIGFISKLLVGYKHTDDPDIIVMPNDENRNRIAHYLHSDRNVLKSFHGKIPGALSLNNLLSDIAEPGDAMDNMLGYEDFNYPGSGNITGLIADLPDIIHAHNLHGNYFDLRIIPKLSHQFPFIITLHDAWTLSGHCAHSFGCERWKTGCGNCPDLSIYPPIRKDATAHNWRRKAEIYKNSRLHIVTPSQWLMDKVNQSMMKPGIILSRVIPNGVDLRVFHPSDQLKARADLELPADANIILFVANGIRTNIWKDYKTLQSALAEIAKTGVKVLCIALGEEAPSEHIGSVQINFIPYQQNSKMVARYYQAADLYVHPARADTFPSTILEALACGVPVVASAVGGIPEQIVDGRTGFLVPVGDAHAMAEQILCLLADEGLRQNMGGQAAEDAARRFGMDRVVKDYLSLYENIRY